MCALRPGKRMDAMVSMVLPWVLFLSMGLAWEGGVLYGPTHDSTRCCPDLNLMAISTHRMHAVHRMPKLIEFDVCTQGRGVPPNQLI